MNIDFRTNKERERDMKHQRIIDKYCTLANEASNLTPHRIMTAVANEFGMTTMGIRSILIKYNIITTKSQQQ